MPLIRRLPKRGFNNAAFHKNYAIVNLSALNAFKAGSEVNEKLLREAGLVRGDLAGIKILGDGELKHALTIEADKVSASARQKIEKAGGTITLRNGGAARPVRSEPTELVGQEEPAAAAANATTKKRTTQVGRTPRAKREKKASGKR
jgi:ribosomal protein L18E